MYVTFKFLCHVAFDLKCKVKWEKYGKELVELDFLSWNIHLNRAMKENTSVEKKMKAPHRNAMGAYDSASWSYLSNAIHML